MDNSFISQARSFYERNFRGKWRGSFVCELLSNYTTSVFTIPWGYQRKSETARVGRTRPCLCPCLIPRSVIRFRLAAKRALDDPADCSPGHYVSPRLYPLMLLEGNRRPCELSPGRNTPRKSPLANLELCPLVLLLRRIPAIKMKSD